MKQNPLLRLFDFVMIFIGSAIAAFAIEEFLVPCTILDGGIIGISMIVNNLTEVEIGILTFFLNLPFLLLGARKLEYWFLMKTESIAILLNRAFGLSVGQTVLLFNVVIFAIAGFLFGWERAMYSLLTYFITSRVIDMVENGVIQAKAAVIITNDASTISEKIYQKLGRTVTFMDAKGLISGEKQVLYCVLTRFEVHLLKEIIQSVDQSAFVTINDVSEIIGTHMKSTAKTDIINK